MNYLDKLLEEIENDPNKKVKELKILLQLFVMELNKNDIEHHGVIYPEEQKLIDEYVKKINELYEGN